MILNGLIVSTHLPSARSGRHEIGFEGGKINMWLYHIVYLEGTLWVLFGQHKGSFRVTLEKGLHLGVRCLSIPGQSGREI